MGNAVGETLSICCLSLRIMKVLKHVFQPHFSYHTIFVGHCFLRVVLFFCRLTLIEQWVSLGRKVLFHHFLTKISVHVRMVNAAWLATIFNFIALLIGLSAKPAAVNFLLVGNLL